MRGEGEVKGDERGRERGVAGEEYLMLSFRYKFHLTFHINYGKSVIIIYTFLLQIFMTERIYSDNGLVLYIDITSGLISGPGR